ncbi:MFS transporter [Sphaerisporangium corydalis]|uniref:MFS transporter n=1 Tax=Sphaerisporangium corydalis TaxID=1441875 RepID=A0ABV9EU85_9ACTN|nr:MFS transporter [Sphaerisporangium corydalis]
MSARFTERPGPATRPGRAIWGLVAAETLSGVGTQLSWVALPWFTLAESGSATRMAAVFAAELLPVALLGPPSAILVARLGAKRVMRAADLCRALLVALVPSLHALGLLSFPVLLLIVCAIGAVTTPYLACQRSVLPELFDDEASVTRANSLVEAGTRFATFAGPAAAGTLIALIGGPNVLWLDAGSYLVSFLLLGLLPAGLGPADGAGPPVGAFAGLRHLWRDPLLARLCAASLLYGFLFPVLLAALPVLTYTKYGGSPAVAGWLFAAWGAGSVAGSVLAYRLADRVPLLWLGGYAAIAAAVPLWPMALPMPAVVLGALMAASGLCVPVLNTAYLSVLTLRPEAELRVPVLTALVTTNTLASAAGFLSAGILLERLGTTPVFLVTAVAATLCAALLMRTAAAFPQPIPVSPTSRMSP